MLDLQKITTQSQISPLTLDAHAARQLPFSLHNPREIRRVASSWPSKFARSSEMMRRLCPVTYSQFLDIFDAIGTPREAKSVELLYEKLQPLNFSKDFLDKVSQTLPAAIAVLPVLGVYWSDWGSPARLVETLERLDQVDDAVNAGESTTRSHFAKPPTSSTFPIRNALRNKNAAAIKRELHSRRTNRATAG